MSGLTYNSSMPPELLAALKVVVNRLTSHEDEGKPGDGWQSVELSNALNTISAAILDAENWE